MHLILLAISCLSVQFVAKYVGHNVKKLPYDLVGLGVLFFLLTAASGLELGGPAIFTGIDLAVLLHHPADVAGARLAQHHGPRRAFFRR